MKKVLITIIVVAVLGLAGWLILADDKDTDNSTPAPTTTQANSSDQSTAATDSETASISYTNNGFEPQSLSVKAGTEVTIVNNSSDDLQFSSDPHPVHTDNAEINMGRLAPGESQTLVVSVTGTHGVHNHLNDSDTMTLIVE